MATKFYDFDQLRNNSNCLQIAQELGMEPSLGNDRFNIPWRDGSDSGALSINNNGWHDFVSGESGDALELVRRVKFNGSPDGEDGLQEAQEWIGDRLGLTPAKVAKEAAPTLASQGYELACSYPYCAADGELRFTVERWFNKETGKKTFLQRNASGRSGKGAIADVDLVLYRLPEWIGRSGVAVVEGEKDADNLRAIGIPATTNNSGAGHWQPSFTESLAGKHVVIFSDNDEPGMKREAFLLWELRRAAKSLKAIHWTDQAKGYDVSDFLQTHTPEALKELIRAAPEIAPDTIKQPDEDYCAVQEAKLANKFDFCNYIESRNGDGEKVTTPRQINDLVQDVFRRFIGFPRKVGETLFDHDRDNRKIVVIENADELFAWLQRKSKKLLKWKGGDGMATQKQLFAAVQQSARRYEEIIKSPVWPEREDTYCEFPPLPPADAEHAHFWRMIEFFSPANDEYQVMVAALFCAPFYYEPGVPRPCWIIDSLDGASSGKTTLAEMVARLTGTEEIRTSYNELAQRTEEVMKRLISASGRQKRVFLMDNVTEQFHCSQFADMITASSLSGRPPYGRGEESRPNNLTYIITANSARMDNDIAQRSYFAVLSKPRQFDTEWRKKTMAYIDQYRFEIIGEIIDLVANSKPLGMPPATRFPEFEVRVLQSCCRGDGDTYNRVLRQLSEDQDGANSDRDTAQRIEDEFKRQLMSIKLAADGKYFIRGEVAEVWLRKAFSGTSYNLHNVNGMLRDLARQGFTEMIDGRTQRVSGDSRRGFLWNKAGNGSVRIIGLLPNREAGVVI